MCSDAQIPTIHEAKIVPSATVSGARLVTHPPILLVHPVTDITPMSQSHPFVSSALPLRVASARSESEKCLVQVKTKYDTQDRRITDVAIDVSLLNRSKFSSRSGNHK